MIKQLLATLLIVTAFSFSLKKEKRFVPPGTVQIKSNFFVDEAEVSNFAWREYELWTAAKYGTRSKEHLASLPDTLVWRGKGAYNEPFVTFYYKHPAYKNYPVVGVSYTQVLAFCKWRTERVKTFYYLKNKKDISFEYRLPTREEWEFMSEAGLSVFTNKGINSKGLYTFNCAREEDTTSSKNSMADNADVTAPVYSYWKNNFGLFNTIGNVAEMVQENGICKGGSWHQPIEDCRVGKNTEYSKPEAWLGFRCVCVVTL